jgi:hypothetical protein
MIKKSIIILWSMIAFIGLKVLYKIGEMRNAK